MTNNYIALRLGKGKTYFSDRMTGKQQWTIDECYWLLDFFGEPHERIFEMFPSSGGSAKPFKPKPKPAPPQSYELTIKIDVENAQCIVRQEAGEKVS